MAARAYWKGFLLVPVSVEVFHAGDRKADIGFRQIRQPNGRCSKES